jgi:predicted unusual protein kinase regulating ubiquinone biosynthesis (AarF/ABC1/UbiB family)
VGFIDFGIVGRISEGTWRGLEALLVAVGTQDYATMVGRHEGVGAVWGGEV